MAETIAKYFIDLFQNKIPNELIIFIISLFPILELRGGLIAASLLNVDLVPAFIICFLGNILPVPFILLFIRKIFDFLRDKKGFSKLIEKLEKSSLEKSGKVTKWRNLGLVLFVAIPLPGTGAWTGSLIASIMEIPIKKAFPLVLIGVVIAGIIMSLFSYGLLDYFIGLF
ncbi:MAG: small multi-drug export protein [Clostridiales bacterium]|nr:small multi-drug export protein [Clostridiales bacterium]